MSEWGSCPDKEYTPGKLASIRCYYDSFAEKYDIDDITWNDLSMDDIFLLLNNTQSTIGEEYLYTMLRKPVYDPQEILYRDRLISHFYEHEEDRIHIQMLLSYIGNNKNISFFEFFSRINDIEKQSNMSHYIINAVWIFGIVTLFINIPVSITALVMNAVYAVYTYYKRKAQIESYYVVFNHILKLLYCAKKLDGTGMPIIQNELADIRSYRTEFKSFKRMSGIVLNPNGGNLLDIILDYIRMVTHIDLIKFNSMLSVVCKKSDIIMKLHDGIAALDAIIAIASFRKYSEMNGYATPDFSSDKRIAAKDIYHPLITEPVHNSIDTDSGILLTGSNASGKSTFLKTIAINQIFAQTIATVNAVSYKTCLMHVMTSMALTDNILDNQSYFIAEILSLKRIFDEKGDIPILCCIDEVLRGTNTVERIAASSQILTELCNFSLCFAATHDIELSYMLEDKFTNYHFREKIENDEVLFDYKLYDGRSTTRNAIKLLSTLGYDKGITDAAKSLCDKFENTGKWTD